MKDVKTQILKAVQFHVTQYLSLNDLRLNNPEVFVDVCQKIAGGLSVSLRDYVWGHHIGTQEIKYPRDWVEAFKERWFPKFLLTKYPVQYKICRIDTHTLYPNYKPALPHTHRLQHTVYYTE